MSQLDQHDPYSIDRGRRRLLGDRATRRSAILTVLGTIIPGVGLLQTRYRRLGTLILLGLVLLTLIVTGTVLILGPTNAALSIAVRPSALLVVAGLLCVGALIWVGTIILTHRGTLDPDMSRTQHARLRTLTGLMCLVVVIPMGTAVSYSLIQRDVVGSLFGTTIQTGADSDAKPGTGADPWDGIGRVNLLLLGSDAGDDRIGVRTDSMMVVSIDPKSGDTLLFSLPRNLENVPFPVSNPLHKLYPKGYNCGPPDCLLNGVWSLAEDNRKLFGDDRHPGLTTIRGVISEITGLRIHYTTVIDLAGFEALVDAMGGVVVTITEDLPVEGHLTEDGRLVGVREWLHPGTQHLDGYHALWYARSRASTDDYSRMRRQRCLVGKILDQVNPVNMLQKYPALARVAKDNISTDIAAEDLPAWVELVRRIQGAGVRSLAFTTQNIKPARPDFPAIRTMILDALDPERATTAPSTSSTPTKSTSPKSTSTKSSPSSSSTSKPTDTLVDLKDAC